MDKVLEKGKTVVKARKIFTICIIPFIIKSAIIYIFIVNSGQQLKILKVCGLSGVCGLRSETQTLREY
jgi:hypothetical protein